MMKRTRMTLMAATALTAFLAIALPTTTTQAAGTDYNGAMPASTSTFGAATFMAPTFQTASTSTKTDAVTDPTTKFKALQTTFDINGQSQLGTDKTYVTKAMKKVLDTNEKGGDIAQQNQAVFGTTVGFQAMFQHPPVSMRDLLKSVAYLNVAKQPAPYFDLDRSRGVRRT